MKKVVKKLNKALSVLLVAAMVVGVTPDVCLVANAEEPTTEAESTESSESSAAVTSEEVAEPVETETAKTPETTAETPATQEENKESETTTVETKAEEPADNTAGEEVVEDGAVLLNEDAIVDDGEGSNVTIPAEKVTPNDVAFYYLEEAAGKTSNFNFSTAYSADQGIVVTDDSNSLYIALPKDTAAVKYTLRIGDSDKETSTIETTIEGATYVVYEVATGYTAETTVTITPTQLQATVSVASGSDSIITGVTTPASITDGKVTLAYTVSNDNYDIKYSVNSATAEAVPTNKEITLGSAVVNSTTAVTIELSAVAKQFAVTTGSTSSANATVKNNSDNVIPASGDTEKATYGTDYVFKVAATEGYKVTDIAVTVGESTINDANLVFTTPEDGSDAANKAGTYTITGTAITGAIVITVTTEATTPEQPVGDDEYKVTESATGATITYKSLSVVNGRVKKGDDIEFTVAVTAENKVVKNVKYTVGGTTEELVADKDGVYTIPAKDITDDVTITVTLADSNKEKNTVTFHIEGATVATAATEPESITTSKEVAKGAKLEFKVTPSGENVLRYVSTTNSDKGALTPSSTGVYSITPVCDMDIYVKATAKTTYTLTLPEVSNGFSVEAYVGDAKKTSPASIKEDEEVTLKVVAPQTANNYKFSKLTISVDGDEPKDITRLTNNEYALGKLTANTTIGLVTVLDDTKDGVYKLTFAKAETSKAGSYTVSISSQSGYEAEPYLTTESSATFTVAAKPGYKLVSVVNGEKEYTVSDDSATGTVTFTADTKAQTITITTEEVAAERGDVTFVNDGTHHLEYEVTGDKMVERKDGDTYQIRTGAKTLDFKVTAIGGYVPEVYLSEDDDLDTESDTELEAESSKDGVYTYSVLAKDAAGKYIFIDEEANSKSITFKYDSLVDAGNTVVKVNNADAYDYGGTYYAEVGDTVTVKLYAKDYAKLTNVTVKEGSKTTVNKVDAASYTLSFKVADDTKIIVESEDLSEAKKHFHAANDTEVAANKSGAYEVSVDAAYTAFVADERTDAKETVAAAAIKEEGAKTTVTVEGNVAKVVPAKEDAGKTITLVLYKEAAKETVVAEFKLAVAKTETSIKVNGKADAVIAQDIDTKVSYPIAFTPATSKTMKLAAKVKTAEAGITANVVDGKLEITTTKAVTDAEIIIYDATKYTEENAAAITGGTVKVSAAASKNLTSGTPTIKQTVASDKELYVQLTAPKNLPELVAGKYVYAVHVKPETATATAVEKTVYIDMAGASQDAVIKVDTAADDVKGKVADYTVDVTVLQVKDKAVTIATENVEANKVAASATSKEVKMATRDPYYEDKLSIKKAASTVYTGQREVKVGTVNFSKNASYLNVSVDVSNTYYGASVRFDSTDNGIYLTVPAKHNSNYTPVGNYNIWVTAVAPESTYRASASFTVKVVRGITDITVNAPTTQVYKQSGKAASVKVAPVLNNGWTGTDKPQSNKVTYKLVKTDGTTPLDNSKITIKNGTVSIAKDYQVSPRVADNQFKVLVEAADFAGNTTKGISDVITITEDKMELGAIVITDGSGKALQGTTFKADELDGMYVGVLNKGVQTKTRYSYNDFVGYDNLTIKSSNKAISVDSYGQITVTKPAKNFTFTATANDGGKAKATSGKYTVDYASAELGLIIASNSLDYKGKEGTETKLSYTSAGNEFINVRLATNVNGNWNGVDSDDCGFYNATISVSGAKTVYKANNNLDLEIVPTAKVVTIKLTDKQAKKDYTYTLTNEGFSTEKAPKVTTKDTLTSGTVSQDAIDAGQANRTVNFTVGGNTAYKYVSIMADYTVKYTDAYGYFLNAGGLNSPAVYTVENNSFTLNFGNTYLYKGSYKLQMTFGNEFDEQGALIPATKPSVVSVKVADPAKVSFKLTNSYKMSIKDTKEVQLTGKASASVLKVNYTEILNANVKGDKNHFRDLFKLNDGKLSLQSDVLTNTDKKAWLEDKNNLYGYVQYNYESLSGVTSDTYTEKITITMADTVQKFSAEKVTVFKGMTTATVSVLSNKQPVTLKSVEQSTGDSAIKATLDANKTVINLTDIPDKEGKYDIKLKVVPESSFDGTVVEIPCTVTVTTKGNRFGFDSNDLKNAQFVNLNDRYEIVIPYTLAGVAATEFVPSITDASLKMTVDNWAEGQELIIRLNKSDLADAKLGKSVKIKVKLTFNDTTIPAENVTIQAVYPSVKGATFADVKAAVEALDVSVAYDTDATATYTNAIAAAKEEIKATIDKMDSSYVDVAVAKKADANESVCEPTSTADGVAYITVTLTDKIGKDEGVEGSTVVIEKLVRVVPANPTDESVDTVIEAISSYLETYSGATNATTVADIVADVKENVVYDTARYRLKMWENYREDATDDSTGNISIGFEVKDIVTFEADDEPYIDIQIPMLTALSATFLQTELQNAFNGDLSYQITNDEAEIKAAVDAWLAEAITNADITYTWIQQKGADNAEHDVLVTAATTADDGSATFKLAFKNENSAVDPDKVYEVSYELTIKTLVEEATLKTDISNATTKAALESSIADALASNDADTIKEAVLAEANEVVANNPYKIAFKAEYPKFTAATATTAGTFKFILTMTKNETDAEAQDVAAEVTLDIAASDAYLPMAEAKAKLDTEFAKADVLQAFSDACAGKTAEAASTAVKAAVLNKANDVLGAGAFEAEYAQEPVDRDWRNLVDIYEFTAPTVKATGSVSFKLKITKTVGEDETTDVYEKTLTLPAITQDINAAKAAVKDAVEAIVLTSDDVKDATALTATQTRLVTAAQAVVATEYTVEVKEGEANQLKVTAAAQKLTSGNATITLLIKKEGVTPDPEQTCTLKIKATQTVAEAKTAVKSKAEEVNLSIDNDTTEFSSMESSISTAVNNIAVIATSLYKVEIKTGKGLAITTPATSAEQKGEAKVTLVILNANATDQKDPLDEVEITYEVAFPTE